MKLTNSIKKSGRLNLRIFLFVKFYNHIVASVVVLYLFYDPMVGLNAVAAGVAARHGDSRIDDVAVAAGAFPFDDGYFVACFDEAGAFHLEFYCSHEGPSPFYTRRSGRGF